jgi:glycosyltransferase involved in cell wall biosynthesis
MYKPKVLVSAPVGTRSGYGARSRDVVRALIAMNKFDITINAVPWGSTPHNALTADDPNDIEIIKRIKPWEGTPDVHIHIVVPNEFANVGKYNIGITAGLEASLVPSNWLEGINRMQLVLASSTFSAEVIKNTTYTNKESGQELVAHKNVGTIFEGADTSLFKKTNTCSEVLAKEMDKIEEKWNFLFVGHWLQGGFGKDRKDIGNLVNTFAHTFKKKQGVGLILKTSGATPSMLDREQMLTQISEICQSVDNDDLPNIYLLHADLFDSEVNDLYNHPKVKAHISFTHGEGFGRPLLEASLSGKPVIAPNWSGHVDFLHPQNSVLLPGGLIKVDKDSFQGDIWVDGQHWFQVETKKAAFLMKDVKKNYRKYSIRARKLARLNKHKFSFDAMKNKLEKILDANLPKFTESVAVKLPKLKKVDSNLPSLPKLKID